MICSVPEYQGQRQMGEGGLARLTYRLLALREPFPIWIERVPREIHGLRVVAAILRHNQLALLPCLKGPLPVLHVLVSTVNPSAQLFTYFGDSFADFKPPEVDFEGPAIAFEGPGIGPLVRSGEDDSVTEESSVARAWVAERVRAFGGFKLPEVDFEGPAIAFEGPGMGPLVGSGEDDSVMEESSVTGAGDVKTICGWVAIGGPRPYSGEGEDA